MKGRESMRSMILEAEDKIEEAEALEGATDKTNPEMSSFRGLNTTTMNTRKNIRNNRIKNSFLRKVSSYINLSNNTNKRSTTKISKSQENIMNKKKEVSPI